MKPTQAYSYIIPFCRQGWRLPAAILLLCFLGTLAWSYHLVKYHRDMLDLELFGHSFHPDRASVAPVHHHTAGGLNVALTGETPADGTAAAVAAPAPAVSMAPVRGAMVNIAGAMKKPAADGTLPPYATVGSGVVINPKGYVITAAHIIQNLADIHVRVQTPSGPRQYVAKRVKVVPEHDLALLKLVTQDVFPYLALENPAMVRVGETVQAWGDPLGTDAIQRSGIVQRLDTTDPVTVQGKPLTGLIATDAVVHWSQSGGPLINNRGRLVGVNIAVNAPTGEVFGYVIPASVLVTHFQELVNFTYDQLPGIAKGNAPAAGATPGPGDPPVVTAGTKVENLPPPGTNRPPRPSDRWWTTVKGYLGWSGQNVALTGPLEPIMVAPDPVAAPAHDQGIRIWGYSLQAFGGLLLLGFVSGVSGGMMTMGGGIIKVTGLMWLFGYGLMIVRPVAYITNIFMYGAAVLRYRREGLLRFDLCKPLIPWAMGGMVVGYFIGNVLNKTTIQWMLGAFALVLGVKMLVEISESRGRAAGVDEDEVVTRVRTHGVIAWMQRYLGTWKEEGDHAEAGVRKPTGMHGVLGLPMGVVSGILGITGGVIEVPLQRYVARVPLRNAIANSATLVFFASLVGSAVALFHGVDSGLFDLQTPVLMAVILTPGAFLGGLAGAWLTSVVPLNTLRWVYAILMFVIAGRMFWV